MKEYPAPFEQKNTPSAPLLRTPEEEESVARHCEAWPKYICARRDGKKEITVYGDKHFYDKGHAAEMRQALETFAPDVVLVEGSNWETSIETLKSGRSLSAEDVLSELGEQAYLTELARAQGIPVSSWDLPHDEGLRRALHRFPAPQVVAWGLFQGVKHLMEQRIPVTENSLLHILKHIPELYDRVKDQRVDLDKLCQDIASVSLANLTPELAERYASPRYVGETNNIVRFINEIRDKNALAIIAKTKQLYDRVFIGCGGSHAVTWEPALEQLYPERIG